MGPEALAQVLRPLAGMFDPGRFPNLIRGLVEPDDALVWKLDDERAIVQTADFFPPVVDDPFAFGQIAAANAMSDVYAMGGVPLFAMNLVGFPDSLDGEILTSILMGGADRVREAGAAIAGGHTTTDAEPKYGLAVTGLIHPGRVLTKGGARPGDVLLLTKPLGTGIVTTAHKKQKVSDDDLAVAVASMTRLSARASKLFVEAWPHVHALTDITGFALVGHAHEMAMQSGVTLVLEWGKLPQLPGAVRYAEQGMLTGGSKRNDAYYGKHLDVLPSLEPWERALLTDPQTSGGLFAAVDPSAAEALLERFRAANEPVWRVGEVVEGKAGAIRVV